MDDPSAIIEAEDDIVEICTYCKRKFVEKGGTISNATNRKRHLDKCALLHKVEKPQKE